VFSGNLQARRSMNAKDGARMDLSVLTCPVLSGTPPFEVCYTLTLP